MRIACGSSCQGLYEVPDTQSCAVMLRCLQQLCIEYLLYARPQGSNCGPPQGVKSYKWMKQKSSTFLLCVSISTMSISKNPPRN